VTLNTSPTTRRMSGPHEAYVAKVMGGRVAHGSGCTYRDQLDGRQSPLRWIRFAWDAKCTLGKSLSITLALWEKVVEQAHGDRPMMALRWYRSQRLDPALDLGVVSLLDLSELCAEAGHSQAAQELLKMVQDGQVQYADQYGVSAVDRLAQDLLAVLDGRRATEGHGLPDGGFPEELA
jgi:hypothetical protein